MSPPEHLGLSLDNLQSYPNHRYYDFSNFISYDHYIEEYDENVQHHFQKLWSFWSFSKTSFYFQFSVPLFSFYFQVSKFLDYVWWYNVDIFQKSRITKTWLTMLITNSFQTNENKYENRQHIYIYNHRYVY